MTSFRLLFCALIGLLLPAAVSANVSVLTQHNDNSRTGANLDERVLNTSNVNVQQFGKLFSRDVVGQIYAQPLYAPDVAIPKQGKHNVVYVATEHNNVYAFDADDPQAAAPLWQVNLGPSGFYTDFYQLPMTDMNDEVGITGTPVIDPKSKTLYVVAKTKENGQYYQRLHALSIETGQEQPHSPVLIEASVLGRGDGNVNGVVSFDARQHLQRPGLLLDRGIVYLAFGSHGDHSPYHGWLLGYDAKSLQLVNVFNTTPDGGEGAIWQAAQGPCADRDGNLYFMTGNGAFDADQGGADLGEAFVKLKPKPGRLTAEDWFTPYNFAQMNHDDVDLGSSGPLLIPDTHYVLGGNKAGDFYLLDRSNFGHYHPADNSQIVQVFHAGNGHIHGSPVYWKGRKSGPTIYVWSEEDYLKAFHVDSQGLRTTPSSQGTTRVPHGMPGGFLSISAHGDRPETGIVWASHPFTGNANWYTVPGILQAFDASDVSKELWNSKQNADRDDVGSFAKFCPPTIANGKVYLATFSGKLLVYGLLNNLQK